MMNHANPTPQPIYGTLVIHADLVGWSARQDTPTIKRIAVSTVQQVTQEDAQRIVNMHTSATNRDTHYVATWTAHPVVLRGE